MSTYFDPKDNLWVAEQRRKDATGRTRAIRRKAKTRTQAEKRLQQALRSVSLGENLPDSPTVGEVLELWQQHVAANRSAKTAEIKGYLVSRVTPIANIPIEELKVIDIDKLLYRLRKELSTRTLRDLRSMLALALDWAIRRELCDRNVARIAEVPKGREGRPSQSFSVDQAKTLLSDPDVKNHWIWPLIAFGLTTGARTEEMKAIRWSDVHLETTPPSVEVYRSVRAGGDTKTRKSRRAIALSNKAVEALERQQAQQRAMLGHLPELVFTTRSGMSWDAANLRREFRAALNAAPGVQAEDWSPRELRHTFASLLSDQGIPIERIAQLMGHSTTATTEKVYRKQLRALVVDGAEAIDGLF